MKYQPKWRSRLQIQNPQYAAIEFLAELNMPTLINRVDVALDICCASEVEARQINDFLKLALVQKWSRDNPVVLPNGGYRTRRNAPTALMHYRRTATVRIELRMNNAQTVRKFGIDTPGDLNTFDIARCFDTRMRLELPDVAALHTALRKRNPDLSAKRIRGFLRAIAADDDGRISAAAVRRAFAGHRWLRLHRIMRKFTLHDILAQVGPTFSMVKMAKSPKIDVFKCATKGTNAQTG